jgi:hypothetical protein
MSAGKFWAAVAVLVGWTVLSALACALLAAALIRG